MLFFDAGTYVLIGSPKRPRICLNAIFDTDIQLIAIWDDC